MKDPKYKSLPFGRIIVFGFFVFNFGCAACHPIEGTHAAHMPDAWKVSPRSQLETIDLSLLRRDRPPMHIVDGGDVLAVSLPGVFVASGEDAKIPVNIPDTEAFQPSVGFPVPVRENGTISLPLAGTVSVRGKTVDEIEEILRDKFIDELDILRSGRDRIVVNLQKPRTFRVLVVRQEASGQTSGGAAGNAVSGSVGTANHKRGSGTIVSLPVYENDVLHALVQSGGLPGLDAENAIYIIRGNRQCSTNDSALDSGIAPVESTKTSGDKREIESKTKSVSSFVFCSERQVTTEFAQAQNSVEWSSAESESEPAETRNLTFSPATDLDFATGATGTDLPSSYMESQMAAMSAVQDAGFTLDSTIRNQRVMRIPIRLSPGDLPNLSCEDVTLQNGDILYVESRESEVYYTAGLLGGGQYTLPRDYDINIVQAISIATSSQNQQNALQNSLGGPSALNQDISVGASEAIILRTLPTGNQVEIKVNLYRALRNQCERPLIQPGDLIVLQYSKFESMFAFLDRRILQGQILGFAGGLLVGNR